MVWAERLFPDHQGSFEERLGQRVLALHMVQRREVVQAHSYFGMVWAEGLLSDRKRAFVEQLGLCVPGLQMVKLPLGCSGSSPHRDGPGRGPSP